MVYSNRSASIGIERRGLACRIEPEEHADRRREPERDDDGVGGHSGRPALPERDAFREPEAERDADAAAERG